MFLERSHPAFLTTCWFLFFLVLHLFVNLNWKYLLNIEQTFEAHLLGSRMIQLLLSLLQSTKSMEYNQIKYFDFWHYPPDEVSQ